MTPSQQTCSICNKTIQAFQRYPRRVCQECAARAKSKDNRPLAFYNESLSGGYLAQYADDGTKYNSHECYIDGIRCRADEAHLGGVVVQVI
ncbi:MAG: hypothetical protein COS37_04195 [Anaerolineae bacterium CG03_land_8_20_14_0_80_58_20]|nr:MAG: hypothetical protein AUJ21_11280 [Anaerolineae bacterium CG1_02_58_13]PIV26872.1 MAG: hypothetical protein COS37_04195 [Anaerolineae bacterium CG03_land_8_20_14_0_80_58_20]